MSKENVFMPSDAYKAALNQAKTDLIHAIQQRDHWNMEVARLDQLVKSLAASIDPRGAEAGEAPDVSVGFTDLVQGLVNRSAVALSPTDVKDAFALSGYDLGGYSNPLALIHQTLKRLATQGKIHDMGDGTYKRTRLFEMILHAWSSRQETPTAPPPPGADDLPVSDPSHPIHRSPPIAKVEKFKPKYGQPDPLNQRGKSGKK